MEILNALKKEITNPDAKYINGDFVSWFYWFCLAIMIYIIQAR